MNYNDKKTSEKEDNLKLFALKNLDDWKLDDTDQDIRGWSLYANGEKVGTVENLIANPRQKAVTYLEVELDQNINSYHDENYRNRFDAEYRSYFDTNENRSILVPVGTVHINQDDQRVEASANLSSQSFANSPRYQGIQKTSVNPSYEVLVARHYTQDEEDYKDDYSGDKFDLRQFSKRPFVPVDNFYTTDLFSRKRYFDRYRNQTPSMTGFNTGMPRR